MGEIGLSGHSSSAGGAFESKRVSLRSSTVPGHETGEVEYSDSAAGPGPKKQSVGNDRHEGGRQHSTRSITTYIRCPSSGVHFQVR
jgi:hypothetical protein